MLVEQKKKKKRAEEQQSWNGSDMHNTKEEEKSKSKETQLRPKKTRSTTHQPKRIPHLQFVQFAKSQPA